MSNIEKAIKTLESAYDKGVVRKLGDSSTLSIEFVPTGSRLLDLALGGGWAKGRLIEIVGTEASGKTTVALHAAAEVQKLGGSVLFVDVEHAFHPAYAKSLGVDIESLYFSQPDNMEQAAEIIEAMIETGDISLVILDSVAALSPKTEIDGDSGDSIMGVKARIMGQHLRKVTPIASKSKTTLMYINQFRDKIGVFFGCLHSDTLVNFVGNESIPIAKVVKNKIKGRVWSYNEKHGTFEPKKIIGWHHNGAVSKPEDFIHIQTTSIDGYGRFGITITPQHKVLTSGNVWKDAAKVAVGDKLITKFTQIVNGSLANFVYAMLCGDSHLAKRDKNTARLILSDTNINYIDWKIKKLSPFFTFKSVTYNNRGKKLTKYSTAATAEFMLLKRKFVSRSPIEFLTNKFSWLGMAVWIMDDGCYDANTSHNRYIISIKRFNGDSKKLSLVLEGLAGVGLNPKINSKDGSIRFNTEDSSLIASSICTFIPECMQYKLPIDYRGKYVDFSLEAHPTMIETEVPVVVVRYASARQIRSKNKYDITVEDTHNYMVGGYQNGVVVHNSPRTTPGGHALKYQASVRVDISKIKNITIGKEEDKNIIGVISRVKVLKNKLAAPFKEVEIEVRFGKGIDQLSELITLALDKGVIKKSGAWFSYEGENIAQGRENLREYLSGNSEVVEKIKKEL